MTDIALASCLKMVRSLARRDDVVMTTGAQTKHLQMVYRRRWYRDPCGWEWLMTRVAYIGAINVVAALATGAYVIMTGYTTARREC